MQIAWKTIFNINYYCHCLETKKRKYVYVLIKILYAIESIHNNNEKWKSLGKMKNN